MNANRGDGGFRCDVCRKTIDDRDPGQVTEDHVLCGGCLRRLQPWLEYDPSSLQGKSSSEENHGAN